MRRACRTGAERAERVEASSRGFQARRARVIDLMPRMRNADGSGEGRASPLHIVSFHIDGRASPLYIVSFHFDDHFISYGWSVADLSWPAHTSHYGLAPSGSTSPAASRATAPTACATFAAPGNAESFHTCMRDLHSPGNAESFHILRNPKPASAALSNAYTINSHIPNANPNSVPPAP